MELRQLEYFLAVAEEANFTRAAERVHISQSGVSAQIRALEGELGVALFDRSGRTARLTDAGRAALEHAREALAAADRLRVAVDDVNGLLRGRLTAGMVQGCEVTPWFAALAAFHGAHPGIELALHEDNSDQLLAGVRSSGLDVALVGIAGEPPPDLASEVIISEGLAALVPQGHPLTKHHAATPGAGKRRKPAKAQSIPAGTAPSHHTPHTGGTPQTDHAQESDHAPQTNGVPLADGVPLAELLAYPLVTLPVGTGIRNVLDRACAAASLKPVIALEASAPGAVADLGARGLGVAVLSRSMAAAFPSLTAVPITGIDIPALLAVVWRRRPTPAVAAFLKHCRAAF